MLLGKESSEILAGKTVAVIGLGGVGGHAVETLARAGIGSLILADKDDISESNINRQLIATAKNVGHSKASEWKKRVLDINPECRVEALELFYLPETRDEIFSRDIDFIVDAVDTVTAKVDLIIQAKQRNIGIISSMGLGNKTDPEKIRITDISETSVCRLARVMRHEMKKRGITDVPVIFSDEEPKKPLFRDESETGAKVPPASVPWVPSVAGIMIGGYVVKKLLGII
jgi:tRNA A37 threonylcarbamoyladenosine dehydratase